MLIGSQHPRTLQQAEHLEQHGACRIQLSIEQLFNKPAAQVVSDVLPQAQAARRRGHVLLLCSAREPRDVQRTLGAGAALGWDQIQTCEHLTAQMASTAVGLLRALALPGMMVCGGASAQATLLALGDAPLRILDQPAPGCALGQLPDGIYFATKNGAFGDTALLSRLTQTGVALS